MRNTRFIVAAGALAFVTTVAPSAAQAQVCGAYASSITNVGTLYFGRGGMPASQAAIGNNTPAWCARQAFLAAGAGLGYVAGTDDLEDQSYALSFTGTTITGALTGTGNDGGFETTSGPPGNNGRYATSGSWSYYDDGRYAISTTPNVNGFGFYGTDIIDQYISRFKVTYNEVNSSTVCIGNTAPACDYTRTFETWFNPQSNGNLMFLGLILNSGNTFNSIDFDANNQFGIGGDTPGYDDFTILTNISSATVVPEPATMSLLAIGLVGMALARRRRNPRK